MTKNIVIMAVRAIKPLPYNPPTRSDERQIDSLVRYMRDRIESELPPLAPADRLVVGCDGLLGDGHRRLAALKRLGVGAVEVEIDSSRTAAEIWRDRNSAMPLNSRQVSQAANLGLDQQYWPRQARQTARQLTDIAGDEAVPFILASGVSLGVLRELRLALNFCGNHDQPFAMAVLRWMIGNKAQRITRNMIEAGMITPEALISAINENRPLRMA